MTYRYPGGLVRRTAANTAITGASGVWDLGSQAQAVKNNTWPISGLANPVSGSLRFRASNSAHLNRTMTTATNNLKWTWSAWVKRGTLGTTNIVFNAGDGSSDNFGAMQFTSGDAIQFAQINGGTYNVQMVTSALFRDPSAWYHVVLVYDSANATSTDRVQIYVNGTRQSVTYVTGPFAPNTASKINSAITHYISKLDYASLYFDGCMAEMNFIDGQALTPSYFGQTSAITGVWEPIKYTGTYGTNGFYLSLSDTSSIGKDFSGNGNNWTPNNISTTSGLTFDLMRDVPTQYTPQGATDVGGVVRGNYATLNPLVGVTNTTFSNGNLTFTKTGISDIVLPSTIAMPSGKFYWETTLTSVSAGSNIGLGLIQQDAPAAGTGTWPGADNPAIVLFGGNGNLYVNGTSSSGTGLSLATNDVVGLALDMSAATLAIYKNGSLVYTATSLVVTKPYLALFDSYGNGESQTVNFGQRPFAYTPPSGFKSLCTTNLPTPTIGATVETAANKYFDVVTYTGDGNSTKSITGVNFQPGFAWVKSRSNAQINVLGDVLRGMPNRTLRSDSTDTEQTFGGGNIQSLDSNGITVSYGSVGVNTNESGYTYVAWQWNAGTANTTNTSGSITSTVRVNQAAGFSIVTYTGNGTSGATVGHGLGVTPSMVMLKQRDGASNWQVKHVSLNANQNLTLNSTASVDTAPGSGYISAISSTTLTLLNGGSAITNVNANNGTYVAYCFAPIAGYSAFGSYTGNGSADGSFVFTGFRPRFVMIKKTSDTGNWWMIDTARSTYNQMADVLLADSSGAEFASGTGWPGIDYLSNGFKLRGSATGINGSGATYIYMAFAETPFKNSLAR